MKRGAGSGEGQQLSSTPVRPAAWTQRDCLLAFVLGCIGLVLTWLIVTTSGAASLARTAPEWALRLDAQQPEALITVAQRRLREALANQSAAQRQSAGTPLGHAKSPAGPLPERGEAAREETPNLLAPEGLLAQRIAEDAKRALTAAPLDYRPLRILAQLADAAGAADQRDKLLRATMHRSKHDPWAALVLMQQAIVREDFAEATQFGDIVLRKHLGMSQFVMPLMAALAEAPGAAVELIKLLQDNPPWRELFFAELARYTRDPRTVLNLLLIIKGGAQPPTSKEVAGFVGYLHSKQLYELGYYAWLQFLDPSLLKQVSFINNGGFEWTPTGAPYDWALPASVGAFADIRVPPGETKKALLIELVGPGRIDFKPVQQVLVLAPGSYRLSYRMKGSLEGRRGLQWILTCVGNGKPLGGSEMIMGTQADWRRDDLHFNVPANNDCHSQQLRLILAARFASEQFVRGKVWFDHFQIERAAAE